MWSQIEASVAVVISSLAPFKSLFSQRKLNTSEEETSGKGLSGRSPGPRLGAYPRAIQLDERSRDIAIHQNGTIGLAGREDSMERILRGYDVSGKV